MVVAPLTGAMQKCLSLRRWRNVSLPFYNEDNALADIGAMITNALQFVSNPEHVCQTLQNPRIDLQGRYSTSPFQHLHQIVSHHVVTHIYYIIFFPDIARGLCIKLGKSIHSALQDTAGLSTEFKHTTHDRCLANLSIFAYRTCIYSNL